MGEKPFIPFLLLLLLVAVYCVVAGSHLSNAYIDLGDGNYLYTSSRMADGLAIYRDFLSPQPPLHLVTGSLLVRLGRALGDPLLAVRIFSIILHVLTALLIFVLGWRLTRTAYGGVLAALIFLVLPIGFWWSLGYQSELPEIFWLLAALVFLLPLRPGGAALAGVLMALAVLTNMTAAPYALAIVVYLAVRHPRRLLAFYLVPLILVLGLAIAHYEVRTGAYFQNVIFNQVGSYPKDGFLAYALGKLHAQGSKILLREGGWILLALLGLLVFNRRETYPEREFLVWYALVLLLSVVYVTKGGTADYIFTIGEPMVALFAAYFICWFAGPRLCARPPRCAFPSDTSRVPQALFVCLAVLVAAYPGFRFIGQTLRQETFEQNAGDLAKVAYYIERYSKPRDRILSPPYYAFVTNRLLVEEYSELFLWSLRYSLERAENKPGEGVRKVQAIARELRARRVPIVVANVSPANPMILRSEEIRSAVERYYKPVLPPDRTFKTLSTDTQIFIPKTDRELAAEPEP